MSTSPSHRIHGTAVKWLGKGIVLCGPPGCGKSDLAIQLLAMGAVFVGDDQLELSVINQQLIASPAAPGLIEVRHLGIFRLPYMRQCAVDLFVKLTQEIEFSSLPLRHNRCIFGIAVPEIMLDPQMPSCTARLRMYLTCERVV